jgi:thiol:disulfide interchange protein DsbD
LLNLMPCVFPVLSLKAINLLECVQISHTQQRLHGIAYSLGAMLFFAAVAAILLMLRAGGATIGWGFQLQSPWFVALLAYLLFVMGLSFSGVLEFGTSFMGVGNDLTRRTGYAGSFFTGALAAVVAPPALRRSWDPPLRSRWASPRSPPCPFFSPWGLAWRCRFCSSPVYPPWRDYYPDPGTG